MITNANKCNYLNFLGHRLVVTPSSSNFGFRKRGHLTPNLHPACKTANNINQDHTRQSMQDDLIARLKQLHILRRGEAPSSSYYLDIKRAYGDAEAFEMMATRLGEKIPNRTNCIAASGYGGLPLAGALSVIFERNLSIVRTEPKDRSLPRFIEGYIPSPSDKVAIVNDVFINGETLQDIIDAIAPTGAEIVGCYVLVKHGEEKLSVPVESLLKVEDLL